ncbi:unannotated protein [freshwater metagenome]|uniref:Unannotated protein n=1 Tax=freshwater metagenome TaxID=449393 RepID=A0A6J7SR45_9ZZZZ
MRGLSSNACVIKVVKTVSKATSLSLLLDSVSCTKAIDAILRTASLRAEAAPGSSIRLACKRNSADTVCRLFLTR